MRSVIVTIISIAVLVVCFSAHDTLAAEEGDERTQTFEVPTTGKVEDVTYRPEFDEWWVKCREGQGIAVYVYERKNERWGRVFFTPKPPVKKGEKVKEAPPLEPDPKPKPEPKPEPLLEKETKPQDKEEVTKKSAEPKPPAPLPQTPPPQVPQPQEKKGKKWWNPSKILEKGKELLGNSGPEPKIKVKRPKRKNVEDE
ncbi:hypothetical protein ACFL2Q_12600, partial [Thermodesulfobacteriota bacterium]